MSYYKKIGVFDGKLIDSSECDSCDDRCALTIDHTPLCEIVERALYIRSPLPSNPFSYDYGRVRVTIEQLIGADVA